MAFHRLVVPTYDGGLPSGYDYINNPALNGDAGTPAGSDGKKAAGVNEGTYFAATTEPAVSGNQNRGNKALAENCDHLDDLLHTSRPVPTAVDTVAGGGGDTNLTITDDVFVGKTGTTNTQEERNRLIAVVDAVTLEELTDAAGTRIQVSAILDSPAGANVVGNGYVTNPNVEFTPTIPTTVNYRLIYLKRGTSAGESDTTAAGFMGDIMGRVLSNIGRQGAWTMSFVPALSTWHDASQLAAVTTQAGIDEVVNALADGAGSDKVGGAAHTGAAHNLSVGSIQDQLREIADVLSHIGDHVWTGRGTYSFNDVETIRLTGATNNGIRMLGSGIGRIILGAAAASSQIRIGAELLFQDSGSVTRTALNLANNQWRMGVGVRMDNGGNNIYGQSDGGFDIGVLGGAGTFQFARPGRIHSAWSHYREDFNVGALKAQYPQWVFSGGALVDANVDGRVALGPTGTSIGNNEIIEGQGATYGLGRAFAFEAIVTINTNITNVIFTVAMTDQSGSNPDVGTGDGVWARFDTDQGDSNWVLVGKNGGALTTDATTTPPVANTWVRFTFLVAADGGAELYINGTREATIAAGSVGDLALMRPAVYIETRTAAAREGRLDKFEMWQAPVI